MFSLVLAILSALALSNALYVPGKELIYTYRARIEVGTNEPLPYASQFYLEGKLHLQYEAKDSILGRFTDLTFRLYNGELNQRNEYESKSLPVPQETADLLKVFRIEYDESGKLRAITTESGERRYSRNIKKAIASILQLDLQKIQANINKPNAFISEERGIYGRGLVEYNVIPDNDQIVVQKMQDVKSSRRWYSYFGISAEPQYTGVPFESPVSIESHKKYYLSRTDNKYYIARKINAYGGIYVHPFSGLYDSQQVRVNQTLELQDIIPVKQNYVITNGERTDQLEFSFQRETEAGTFGISIDRHRENREDNIRLVQRLLEGVITYLETNQLTLDAPNVKQGQSINELNAVIGFLDIPTLEQIFTQLNGKTDGRGQKILQIFLQIVPLVGTRATTVFVRNLVRDRRVNDQIAVELLNKLSFYLRQPSEKLLVEVEDLLHLGDNINPEVRRTGVLTFASLIHKVFAHQSWLERNHEHLHIDNHEHLTYHYPGNWNSYHVHQHPHEEHVQDNTSDGSNNENQLLERYIVRIVNLLKSSQDYLSKYLYMQALYNIQVGNVAKYLEPYVRGEVENVNRHLRVLAIIASFAGTVNNSEKVFTTYWPIFTNRNLHLELRTAAYVTIMYTRPTMSKWWNIYWFMQTEHCPELYNFYYTHLQSLATTQDPLLQDHRLHAQQILKFVRKPYKPSVSGNYILGYKDPKYGYGVTVQSMYISTKTSKTLVVDLTNHIQNVPFHYYTLYFKIDGLDASVAAKLTNDKVLHIDIQELQELIKLIGSLQDQKNLHIEYAIMNYNQIVKIGYYDNTNIKDLLDGIRNIQIENNRLLQNSLDIQYHLLSQLVLPNDLGLPTIVQIKHPSIRNNAMKFTREIINKVTTNIQGEVRLQHSIQNTQEILIYNPILDVWQGVNRIRVYDSVIPLKLNLAINTQQHSMKLTLNNLREDGTVGLRSYISTNTYIEQDVNHYLQLSNPKCNNVEDIDRRNRNRKTYTLYEIDDENSGLNYQVAILNSTRQLSRKEIRDFVVSIVENGNRNIEGSNLVQSLLTLGNLWTRIVYLPNTETSGIIIRAVPSNKNQISHIDLSLRYNQEINRDESIQLPSAKLNSRATYSIKEGERVLKSWDVNAIFELNAVHTVNNLKLQITKIVPDQKDYKICIDGIKKWIGTGVTGHLSITAGRSGDGKCSKDEALIDINMKGEPIQIENGEQRVNVPAQLLYLPKLRDQQVLGYRTVDNILKNTDIQRYVYDVKAIRIPENVSRLLLRLLNVIQRVYNPYVIPEDIQTQIGENNVQVIVEYPIIGNQVNLQVLRPQQIYNISGIQASDLRKLGLQPDNYLLSRRFLRLYELGLTQSCLINRQLILNGENNVIIDPVIKNEWVKVVGNSAENPTLDVSVRRLDDQNNRLALRVVQQDQRIEVVPIGDQIQVKINGQQVGLDNRTLRQEGWYSIGRLNDVQSTIVLDIYKYGLYISVNRDSIQLDAPRYASGLIGQCISS